jgi:hypothetical protein
MKYLFYVAVVMAIFAAAADENAQALFGRRGRSSGPVRTVVCRQPVIRRNNVNVNVNRDNDRNNNRNNDNDRDDIAEQQIEDGFERSLELAQLQAGFVYGAGAGGFGGYQYPPTPVTGTPPATTPPVTTPPVETAPPVETPPATPPQADNSDAVTNLEAQINILKQEITNIKNAPAPEQKPFWIKVEDPRGLYSSESQKVLPGQEVVLKLAPIQGDNQ